MFYLVLDILIYNFTPYLSYFFILNLNNKSYIYNLSVAIIIDYILHTYFYNIIFVTLLFLLKKYVLKFNYNNFNVYFLVNLLLVLIYSLVSMIIFSYISIWNIVNVLIVNSIFITICYKKDALNIKYFR